MARRETRRAATTRASAAAGGSPLQRLARLTRPRRALPHRDFRRLFDNALDAILILDPRDETVLDANAAASTLYGLPRQELIGSSMLGRSKDTALSATQISETVGEGGRPRRFQTVQYRSDGSELQLEVNAWTFPFGGREVILSINRDVTAMAALESSLRRNALVAEMGRLVAGVAHEVRNPLFTISATLDAFERRLQGIDQTEIFLANLRKAISRLNTLMQELLDFGKPPSASMTPHPLSQVIDAALSEVLASAPSASVDVLNHVTPAAGRVLMDRSKLRQAFQNVLQNAIVQSPAGAAVVITAVTVQEAGRPWIACAIDDRGGGFSAEALERMFEPFFTTRRGGTGLGLSIVQRIVEQHGGRVVAANRDDGGARMTLLLPLHVEEPTRTGGGDGTAQSADR